MRHQWTRRKGTRAQKNFLRCPEPHHPPGWPCIYHPHHPSFLEQEPASLHSFEYKADSSMENSRIVPGIRYDVHYLACKPFRDEVGENMNSYQISMNELLFGAALTYRGGGGNRFKGELPRFRIRCHHMATVWQTALISNLENRETVATLNCSEGSMNFRC